MIQPQRIKILNQKSLHHRKFVLYWMQASQRTEYNHALEYAIQQANELNKPLVVCFGIMDHFPEANERHYYFMLEGLKEVQTALQERNIKMVIRHQSPEIGVAELSRQADLVVVDRGYLKIQRAWRSGSIVRCFKSMNTLFMCRGEMSEGISLRIRKRYLK